MQYMVAFVVALLGTSVLPANAGWINLQHYQSASWKIYSNIEYQSNQSNSGSGYTEYHNDSIDYVESFSAYQSGGAPNSTLIRAQGKLGGRFRSSSDDLYAYSSGETRFTAPTTLDHSVSGTLDASLDTDAADGSASYWVRARVLDMTTGATIFSRILNVDNSVTADPVDSRLVGQSLSLIGGHRYRFVVDAAYEMGTPSSGTGPNWAGTGNGPFAWDMMLYSGPTPWVAAAAAVPEPTAIVAVLPLLGFAISRRRQAS